MTSDSRFLDVVLQRLRELERMVEDDGSRWVQSEHIDVLVAYVELNRDRDVTIEQRADLTELREIVEDQANSQGLWVLAKTHTEMHLQEELRHLHDKIERATRWWTKPS